MLVTQGAQNISRMLIIQTLQTWFVSRFVTTFKASYMSGHKGAKWVANTQGNAWGKNEFRKITKRCFRKYHCWTLICILTATIKLTIIHPFLSSFFSDLFEGEKYCPQHQMYHLSHKCHIFLTAFAILLVWLPIWTVVQNNRHIVKSSDNKALSCRHGIKVLSCAILPGFWRKRDVDNSPCNLLTYL